MLYTRPPSTQEYDELQRMTRQEIGRVSQRAHLILLSAQHSSVPHLVQIFGLSAHRVRFGSVALTRLVQTACAMLPAAVGPARLGHTPSSDWLMRCGPTR